MYSPEQIRAVGALIGALVGLVALVVFVPARVKTAQAWSALLCACVSGGMIIGYVLFSFLPRI